MTSRIFGRSLRRAAILALAVAAATASPAFAPAAAAGTPPDDYILVRMGPCGQGGWDNNWDTQDRVVDLSVWCYSRDTVSKMTKKDRQKYPTNTGTTGACRLKTLVNVNVPVWASAWGCVARTKDVTAIGSVVYAPGDSDASGTGNHCHVNGLTKEDLIAAFKSKVNCP